MKKIKQLVERFNKISPISVQYFQWNPHYSYIGDIYEICLEKNILKRIVQRCALKLHKTDNLYKILRVIECKHWYTGTYGCGTLFIQIGDSKLIGKIRKECEYE